MSEPVAAREAGRAAVVLMTLGLMTLGAPAPRAQQPLSGSIRGTVTDKDFGVPLPRVRVTILEAFLATQTGPDGSFLFERVPPGTYTLAFTRDGYQRQVVPEVVANPGALTEIRAQMSIEVTELEEVVVTGQDLLAGTEVGLLDIRAEASIVQDAISSEIMTRTGASDVAGALKFVVGTSVSEGKYAVVRGLSDRYTGTTLNRVRVPSADPRRRAVQVDLFPTGTIESVTVTKTFTPDLQGDFTGGGIDIRTKAVPDERIVSIAFGTEHNSRATGNGDFLTYAGGGVTRLGIAGSGRRLPDEAGNPLPPLPAASFSTTQPAAGERLAAARRWDEHVRAFSPVVGVSRREPGPNVSFAAVAGNRFDQGGGTAVGVLGAVTYTHKYDLYEGGQNNTYQVSDPSQPLVLGQPRIDSAGADEVLLGILGSVAYQAGPRHEIGLRLIGNQSAQDEARLQTNGDEPIQVNQALHYTERTVGSGQLHGRHAWTGVAFKELRLEWFAAYNRTRQEEPDVRFFIYNFYPSTMTGLWIPGTQDADRTRRIFRSIDEAGPQAAVDLTLPFDQWTKTEGQIKAGLYYDETDRDYTEDSFVYTFPNQFGNNAAVRLNRGYGLEFHATSPGQLWSDVFSDPSRIGLATNRCPQGMKCGPGASANPAFAAPNQLLWVLDPQDETDLDYAGRQSVQAAYAMVDLPLGPALRVVAGARYETTEMSIVPHNDRDYYEVIEQGPSGDRAVVSGPLITREVASARIDEASLLPSLGVIYSIRPEMKLRASWSRTIARPTFRELAPVAAEEFLAGDEFVGNSGLQLSDISNYDLRWEWFRRPGEVLAASLFYKSLRNPIELISFAVAGGRSFVQPVNYDLGRLQGAEVEARFPLGGLAKALEGFTVGANYTVLDSSVDVPGIERLGLASFGLGERTRRLQGQPANLFNASLSYDNDRLGISSGLFYNVVGETLATGAASGVNGGTPDSFDLPFRTLDFTYTQKLTRGRTGLTVSLKAKNLLQPGRETVYRAPDGQEVVRSLRDTAILYGLSFGLKW